MKAGTHRTDNRKPTIYLITAYRHNHIRRGRPIDQRFYDSQRNYVYYFVDDEGKVPSFARPTIIERDIHPEIQSAGRAQLSEWTFLLTEYLRPFASYPLFMISTRFYEKNGSLLVSLDEVWDRIFHYLDLYGYGYLPSYERDFGFVDYVSYYKHSLIGTTLEGIGLINSIYDVDFLRECRYFSDFFCNYIGFSRREELERYVEFYLPIINYFFDGKFNEIRSINSYTQRLKDVQLPGFVAEKPLALFLELISHLFFYKQNIKFFGLSYDGFYEVNERLSTGRILERIDSERSFYDDARQAGERCVLAKAVVPPHR